MRTVFISKKPSICRRVLDGLAEEGRRSAPAASPKLPAALARAVAAPAHERVIVGGPDEVKERLNEYKKNLGMNLLVVRPQVPGANESQRRDSFDLLVGEVLPALN